MLGPAVACLLLSERMHPVRAVDLFDVCCRHTNRQQALSAWPACGAAADASAATASWFPRLVVRTAVVAMKGRRTWLTGQTRTSLLSVLECASQMDHCMVLACESTSDKPIVC